MQPDKIHLDAAMNWLSKSQNVTGCGGSSGVYFLSSGWSPPYPETTGYIIVTFLSYAKFANDIDYVERAKAMGDWEVQVQLPSGAVRGGLGINDYPIVFNTGQVILGWIALYEKTKLDKYLNSAINAADWLVDVQDKDGNWSQYTYKNIPHTYNVRVAWSLLEVYKHTKNKVYKDASKKNVLYTLSLVSNNSWFKGMNFTIDKPPNTHAIGYTLRGLLESSFYFNISLKQEILKHVTFASEKILRKYEINKKKPYMMPNFLSAIFDKKWNSVGNYSCLTGNAQIAIIWLKLYKINNDARFLNSALKIIDQIKMIQNLKTSNDGIRGGVAGSYPIWGGYMPYAYPNWATKFFSDALMYQEEIMKDFEEK